MKKHSNSGKKVISCAAMSILEGLCPDQRDCELSRELVELRGGLTILEDEFRADFAAGHAAELRPKLVELSRLTSRKEDLRRLKGLADEIEEIAISWRRARENHEYSRAVALLERLPESLRDRGVYRDLIARRDRVADLELTVREAVRSRRFSALRPDVEELLQLVPDHADLTPLREILSVHQEAIDLLSTEGRDRQVVRNWTSFCSGSPMRCTTPKYSGG